ncbi:MAG: antigen flippase, partial [Mariniblastus sp.]
MGPVNFSMKQSEKPIALESRVLGAESNWNSENTVGVAGRLAGLFRNSDLVSVLATFLTTLSVFGIYLIQGIILAKILGPVGRGEFGTAMFFPRDVFLYAGLFGGIEIVNSYAVRELINVRSLKYSAAKVGLISGVITAVVAAVVSVVVLVCVGKMYLIPFCLACCLFVPWEHMQLTISAVDRGTRKYFFYNLNRLLYAATFLFLLVVVFGLNLDAWIGISSLWLVCCLFVLGRVIGIVPTLRGMDVWNQVFRRSSLATVVHRSA